MVFLPVLDKSMEQVHEVRSGFGKLNLKVSKTAVD
jgi:hypothetical protein